MVLRQSRVGIGSAFIQWRESIPGTDAGKVLRYAKTAIAKMVNAGRILDVPHLRLAAFKILRRNAKKFSNQAWNRENPVVPGGPISADGSPQRQKAWVSGGTEAESFTAPEFRPEDGLVRAELLKAVLIGVHRLGYLGTRIIMEYRRYEETMGKQNGAYPHIARLVELDEDGTFVRIRAMPIPKPKATIKKLALRIRKLHLKAVAQLTEIALGLGFNPPRSA